MNQRAKIYALQKHLQRNEIDAAESLCGELREEGVKSPDFYLLCGVTLLHKGDYNASIQTFLRGLDLKPESADILNNLGTAYRRAGLFTESEEAYQRALEIKVSKITLSNLANLLFQLQRHNDLHHLLLKYESQLYLGYALYVLLAKALELDGKNVEALSFYERASLICPQKRFAHERRALLLTGLRRFAEALDVYDALQDLQGDLDANFFVNKGNVLKAMGRSVDARSCYERAINLDEGLAEAYTNLGIIFKEEEAFEKALEFHKKAISLNPNLAVAHMNAGVTCRSLKRDHEAIDFYLRAVELAPHLAEALTNLGATYRDIGEPKKSEETLLRAIEANPHYAEAYNNLGIIYRDSSRREEALEALHRAVSLKPSFHEAWVNYGNTLKDQGLLIESIAAYSEAISLKEDLAEAHWGRALCFLLQGDFEKGFKEYDWRWKTPEFKRLSPDVERLPIWSRSEKNLRSILVTAEQGLGDTLHFVRFLYQLREEFSGDITFWVQPRLVALIKASHPSIDVVGTINSKSFDCRAPLMSLPRILGFKVSDLPVRANYLRPPDALIREWASFFRPYKHSLKIGIAWQGNPKAKIDRNRSIPINFFKPIFSIPGAEIFSLQQADGLEQLQSFEYREKVNGFPKSLDIDGAFLDTSAIISHLDVVVTSDTAIAHLSGALGTRTFLALQKVPEWRWQLDRQDSPWYPSMRLFRQPQFGDWESVFQNITAELRRLKIKESRA